jgi:ribosome-binding factor A
MAGNRIEKFEKQVQRDLGTIFQQKSRDWFGGAFITVSKVRTSPDLGYVKVFVSMLNIANQDSLLEEIEFRNREIRMELAKELKHLKKIPELTFYKDDSLEYALKMEKLFESIKKKDEEK